MKTPHSPIRNPQSSLTPLDYSYRLLARRAYSEQELVEKLTATGFTVAGVARTIARLKEQGYLDDVRLAADQAELLRARGFGTEGIKEKLAQKGLSSSAVEQILEVQGEEPDLESARRLLSSRFSADTLKQPQVRARAFRLLMRRGYTQDIVERLLGTEIIDSWHRDDEP